MAVPISRQTLTNALLMTLNVTGSICSTRCSVLVVITDPHFWNTGDAGVAPTSVPRLPTEHNCHHPGDVILAIHALDVGDIREPLGRHEDNRGSIPPQERVRRHGSAHANRFEFTGWDSTPGNGVHVGVAGSGRRLGDNELPGHVVDPDQIGTRPACIDSEAYCHRSSSYVSDKVTG